MGEIQNLDGSHECQVTMIAQLYTKILLTVPLFSLIYFLLSWAFVACFVVFLFYHYQKKSYQSNNLSGYSALGQADDDDQDEDLQAFINKGLYGGAAQEEEENDALNQMMEQDARSK